jgi:hypothetical protein
MMPKRDDLEHDMLRLNHQEAAFLKKAAERPRRKTFR